MHFVQQKEFFINISCYTFKFKFINMYIKGDNSLYCLHYVESLYDTEGFDASGLPCLCAKANTHTQTKNTPPHRYCVLFSVCLCLVPFCAELTPRRLRGRGGR